MKDLKLTHANINTEIFVSNQAISWYYYSQTNRCTHVIMRDLNQEKALIPVKESVEEIYKLRQGETNE